jgi:hypothetical protein
MHSLRTNRPKTLAKPPKIYVFHALSLKLGTFLKGYFLQYQKLKFQKEGCFKFVGDTVSGAL